MSNLAIDPVLKKSHLSSINEESVDNTSVDISVEDIDINIASDRN